jgi:hypothetical protein
LSAADVVIDRSMSGTNAITTLIWNERTKLLADALDRASTAVAAGGVFPLINAWRSSQETSADTRVWLFLASAYIFVFAAVMLHLAA